ncbi:exonuclease SbcCD subunit D [Paramicrobacterium chengjingii]|uniref:Nuclease SbcCD subunit D n=1 Tax=Paramicrobacterium chengjingii TaxID=2769067 RepID=A0ABX6YH52_9MICO|nr:exonuclease SbcCD subunit D [Microbacterium chengjingii]QPZ37939.1 exonuclease SbcCD subunit D [Microbacterium chengjingii]
MRILHTSDWHIGRSFHGHQTLDALDGVLEALTAIVREREIDVVIVAGDVFDSATPSADAYRLLTRALTRLRETGAVIVVTSGNHDSAARLGFQSEFARLAGIHVFTSDETLDVPITVNDDDGPVHFYGIPYLEPALIRHRYPGETLRTQADVVSFAMRRVHADAAERGGRSVVVSHCFAQGVADAASDVERDITSGGIDLVPASVFEGVDYAALGHIHGRATLTDSIRYSGAPLHYSFSEARKPRGVWLVELDTMGLREVEWVDLPIPRRLSILTGTLDELLTDDAYTDAEDDWVSAVLTDTVRPLDAMRKLQRRFPHCATMVHEPSVVADHGTRTYAQRVQGKSDVDVIDEFLTYVRNGQGATAAESEIIREAVAEVRSVETSA